MSAGSSNAQVIASYAAFVQGNYFSVAARALFLWDYFVTLDREVKYIWGAKLSAASGLFIVNRYVNLVITVLELIEQAPFQTPQSCRPVVRVLQSLLIFSTFIVALFAMLRVYATWSRDWRPALPVLLLALVTPIANLYMDIVGDPIPAPRPSVGCAIRTNILPDVYSHIVIAERVTTSAYDGLVLLFTILKTLQARNAAISLQTELRLSITALLLRDGTIYFFLLLAMNLAQIIVAAEVPGNNFIAFFVSPLTSILISRFLLDLRQVAHASESTNTGVTDSAIISTHFPSIYPSSNYLGNMGATLYSVFEAETAEGWYDDEPDIAEKEKPFLDRLVIDVRGTSADVELANIL